MQQHDLQLGSQVHNIVVLCRRPVDDALPVLAHHDHGRLQRRDHRKHQVEEDKGVGIKGPRREHGVHDDPGA